MQTLFRYIGNKLFILILIFFLVQVTACTKSKPTDDFLLIPLPERVEKRNSSFLYDNTTKIIITDNQPELRQIALFLQNNLNKITGRVVDIDKGNQRTVNAIILSIDSSLMEKETYKLEVDKKRILIKAGEPAGIFYGIQTLLQLMPVDVFNPQSIKEDIIIPGYIISDSPRFTYRAMHLDVARNFFTVEEVKKYIDLLALYKYNYLHWHLTDGAGWRIEIKKYPLLTQKAAFRPYKNWKDFWKGKRDFVDEHTTGAVGGYYTQDEIREIVAYAAERFITIIPEIEMPSHSEEVFVAYPHLSCSGKPYVNGEYCIGNEEVFPFLEDILTEIMQLFPSRYIHIGGDEANKTSWEGCPKCRKRMRDERLNNVDELQAYFINRIQTFLTANHRKTIGWDEILEGKLNPEAVVMVWRSEEYAHKAALNGNKIIMAPASHCYFDYYQSDPATEPEAIGAYVPLSKVYEFEPVLTDFLTSFVLGAQANIWTEYISEFSQVEYMVYPRAIALSEVLWTTPDKRDWDYFKKRLPCQLQRLDYLDVNYYKPSYLLGLLEHVDTVNKCIGITFDSEQYRPEIRYTLDGTTPTWQSALYDGIFYIDRGCMVSAAIIKEGEPQQPVLKRDTGYHTALGKKVIYNTPWDKYPAGGKTALVDGKRGGFNYSDNLWQGFTSDLDVIIDLGSVTDLKTFNARFMQLIGPCVFMPGYVEVSLSNDNIIYETALNIKNDIPVDYERLYIKDFSGDLHQKQARYIRVFAKNNHDFIFTDEIVIN